MAKHFIEHLRNELDLLYNGSDTIRVALIREVTNNYIFTADSATKTLTSEGHNFVNGSRVKVANSNGSLPTGLNSNDVYYIIGVSGNDFKLSLTRGGAPTDITSNGAGTQTILEQTFDETDDLSILARHEVDYYGATVRPVYNPDVARADYTNKLAYLPTEVIEFAPTQASIDFRYVLLIRGGAATRGDVTGNADQLHDYGTTQIIQQGSIKGIEIYIQRRNG